MRYLFENKIKKIKNSKLKFNFVLFAIKPKFLQVCNKNSQTKISKFYFHFQ